MRARRLASGPSRASTLAPRRSNHGSSSKDAGYPSVDGKASGGQRGRWGLEAEGSA